MNRIRQWWHWLVSVIYTAKAISREQAEAPNEAPKTEPKLEHKKRNKPRQEIASLGDLLGTMDETFKNFAIPFSKHSWISRSEAIGLRKLGAHIPHPPSMGVGDPCMQKLPTTGLPTLFFVAPGWSRFDNEKSIHAALLFGIKVAKLPAEVTPTAGIHYKFGVGYKIGISSCYDSNKELFWASGYITILADGSTHIHDERCTSMQTIRVKSAAQRRAVGKTITIPTRRWLPASIVRVGVDANHPIELMRKNAQDEFASALIWWMSREDRWNVIVKKSGERVTFGIPKELTKNVFRDRIKVKTPDGLTKPIFHYVKAHTRANGSYVKEHVRGLDHFSWNAYQCQITAPKLTSTTAATFLAPAVEHDDDEDYDAKSFIDISMVGKKLAELEEVRRAVA